MLAGDDSAGQFAGGTVYQAFLSATNDHRWHSPVAGTIRNTQRLPGSSLRASAGTGVTGRSMGWRAGTKTSAPATHHFCPARRRRPFDGSGLPSEQGRGKRLNVVGALTYG